MTPTTLLLIISCGQSSTAPAMAAPPAEDTDAVPVAEDDVDGDGFGAAVDCDETDPAVSPGAVEVCTNAVDDDCDARTDAGDTDCPLQGEVTDADADAAVIAESLLDPLPHVYPRDGRLALWDDDGTSLRWYDYADALEGMLTELASLPTGMSGVLATTSLHDLPDVEGDGQTDFFVPAVEDGRGLARFGALGTQFTGDEAALLIEGIGGLGLGSDRDGDAVPELVGAWQWHSSSNVPGVAWFPSALTGAHDYSAASLTLRVWEGIEGDDVGYDVYDVSTLDAEGDGLDETLLYMLPGDDEWGTPTQNGWAFAIPSAAADDTTLAEAAVATVNDGTEPLYKVGSHGDLDGDGYDDLLASFGSDMVVLLGPFAGNAAVSDAVATLTGQDLALPADAGDFDGDGALDMLVLTRAAPEADHDFYILSDPLLSGGLDGARLHVVGSDARTSSSDLALQDIDGDGREDIVGDYVFFSR